MLYCGFKLRIIDRNPRCSRSHHNRCNVALITINHFIFWSLTDVYDYQVSQHSHSANLHRFSQFALIVSAMKALKCYRKTSCTAWRNASQFSGKMYSMQTNKLQPKYTRRNLTSTDLLLHYLFLSTIVQKTMISCLVTWATISKGNCIDFVYEYKHLANLRMLFKHVKIELL